MKWSDIWIPKSGPNPLVFWLFWLRNVFYATTACTFLISESLKKVRTPNVLDILISKCASHYSGVHFFDISTAKSGPELVCFEYFDLDMSYTLQRRVFFRHLNGQKWPGLGEFCIFWLGNGSAPAALTSVLFDPPEPQIIGKTAFRDFPTFSHTCIFFLLTLSFLWPSLFFSSLWLFPSLLFICLYCWKFDF